MTTFKVGDRVRVTPGYAAWYRDVWKRGAWLTTEISLTIDSFNGDGSRAWVKQEQGVIECVPIEYLTTTEHDPDTAQAVIEAARAVMKHVSCEILVSRVTYNTLLRVSIRIHDGEHVEFFDEAYSEDFPDTLFGQLAALSAALEAHDEAAIGEDE